jgi:chromosome segregation ATPase
VGDAKHYCQKILHTISQFAMPQTRRLARELSAVVDNNQLLTVELERVRNEFESARDRDRNLVAEFGQRITGLESGRDTAHQQLHDLKTLLTEASVHQESTATQVRQLECKLDEEYAKHESLLDTMHVTLMQVQNKQQTLLEFQSDVLHHSGLFGKIFWNSQR